MALGQIGKSVNCAFDLSITVKRYASGFPTDSSAGHHEAIAGCRLAGFSQHPAVNGELKQIAGIGLAVSALVLDGNHLAGGVAIDCIEAPTKIVRAAPGGDGVLSCHKAKRFSTPLALAPKEAQDNGASDQGDAA